MYWTGIKLEKTKAPKPMLEPASNNIGYPTLWIVFSANFSFFVDLDNWRNCEIKWIEKSIPTPIIIEERIAVIWFSFIP